MNGLFCAGGLFGAIFVGWSCDALGRKPTLWIASPLAIIGGALQAGAVHIAMFLVGRFIGGFAVGLFCRRLF
jgi:predicted MFS family arabinose efflux permease